MNRPEFEGKVKGMRQRVDRLRRQVAEHPEEVIPDAFQELQNTLEDLQVAEEELRAQNEELVASQAALEAERRRYQELFDLAPDGYLVTDPKAVIREANQAAAALLGLSQERLVGKSLSLFVAKAERRAFRVELALLAGEERLEDWQVPLQPRRGEPFPASLTAATVRDEAGQLVALRWLVREITERRRAEEALREAHDKLEVRVRVRASELEEANTALQAEMAERIRANRAVEAERRRLYDVLDTLPVYVVLLTPDHHVPFANRFFREHFGEAHGRRCFEYLFGRTAPCEKCETYKVLDTKAPLHWEWTGPDGRGYDIFDFPFTDADGSPLIMEVGVDVTERKRAETLEVARRVAEEKVRAEKERADWLRTILDELPAGVVIASAEGKILLANRAVENIWGVKAAALEQMGYGQAWQILRPDGAPLPPEELALQRALRGEAVVGTEEVLVRPDGGRVPVVCSAVPLLEEGRVEAAVVAFLDITERRRAEEALRKRTHDLGERMKELKCLYAISKLLGRQDISMLEMLEGTLHPIPPGWQYPEITCARVILGDQVVITENFKETTWRQASTITVHGDPVGTLEVYYLEERPESDEGPFLKEERELIDGIAERLSEFVERKQAAEEIESLARFPGENPNPILRVTGDGTILFANRVALDLWGCQAGQAVPDDWRQPVLEALRSGSPGHLEAERGAKVFTLTLAPVVKAGYVNLYGLDVTGRKQAEEELRESEERFRTLTEVAPAGMVLTGPRGHLTYVNKGYCQITGREAGDLLGWGWTQALHPDDHDRVAGEWAEAAPQGRPYDTSEYRFLHLDGRVVWAHAVTAPLRDQAGELLGHVAVISDITESKRAEDALRESEERFRIMSDSIPQLAWMAHGDGFIFWYNRRWYEYTGTKPQQMQGWGWQSVHDPEMLPKVLDQWKASISTGEPFDMEFPLRGADGRFRWFLTRVMPAKDSEGRVTRWFGTNTDITEQKEMQRRLVEANAELARLNRLKDEFLSLASHELKTPVTSIKIFAELAQRRPEKVDDKLMETLARQADQLTGLINSLLDVARLQMGKMPVELRPLDLVRLAGEFCERARPMFPQHVLSCPVPNGGLMIEGDPLRLEQVLSNLLDNARKFTPEGGRIAFRVGRRGDKALIEVEDSGIGIPPKHLPHVFERFYKPGAHQAVYSGLGVGLYICQEIVERHGGRIWVESTEGLGSRFFVELPLAE